MGNPPVDNDLSVTRRTFIRKSAGVAVGLGPVTAQSDETESGGHLKFLEPIDGAVLHARLGKRVADDLEIEVAGTAPIGAKVLIQGRPANNEGGAFRGTAILRGPETEIVATIDGNAREECGIRVLWEQNSRRRYRFAIDDNSFFLRDITQKKYASLFDCFYLGMLRDLHARHGARFTLNIYYTTDDGWDLRQFPDRYRREWEENATWLRLAFHAYANEPACPYEDAPVEKLLADLDLIAGEIHRFAGPATYSPPIVIHWGMTRPEAWRKLHERGARVLGGYFRRNRDRWEVNYRVDEFRSEWLSRHDLLKDFPSGIVFSKIDMVVNSTPLGEIVPKLESLATDPRQGEIIDLLTHEQYFWPFYKNYLPDHALRMERAIEFLTRQGYESVFLQDEMGAI